MVFRKEVRKWSNGVRKVSYDARAVSCDAYVWVLVFSVRWSFTLLWWQ